LLHQGLTQERTGPSFPFSSCSPSAASPVLQF
jgi:hypothetical protein